MSRGRHAKPSGLLSRLFPGRAARRRAEAERERALLRELHYEVHRLRGLLAENASTAAMAAVRAKRAEEQVRAVLAESVALRTEVSRLREELLWAWAEGRLPAAPLAPSSSDQGRVIDLRQAAGG
jgi:hypothetical protein